MNEVETMASLGASARKQAKQARKEFAKKAVKARKQVRAIAEDLAEAVYPSPKRRRRWPWLVALLVGGAAAVVVLSRRPREVRLEDVPDDAPGAADRGADN
jgi:hypothetical protein